MSYNDIQSPEHEFITSLEMSCISRVLQRNIQAEHHKQYEGSLHISVLFNNAFSFPKYNL
jgi:hypothetical protein